MLPDGLPTLDLGEIVRERNESLSPRQESRAAFKPHQMTSILAVTAAKNCSRTTFLSIRGLLRLTVTL